MNLSPLKPLWQRHKQIDKGCIGLFLLWLFCLTVMVGLLYIHIASRGHVNFIPKQQSKPRNIITKWRHGCDFDLYNGRRAPVSNGPLYHRQSYTIIPESKNCDKNGKENAEYLNWRSKSFRCELERFEAETFLRIVRGKTLVFIGDSVARNQMKSLLCLLSQEQTPINKYKGSDNHFAEWYFPSHNFTVKALWTKFFVTAKEKVINDRYTRVDDFHLDKLNNNWTPEFPSTDIVIISDAHWFFPPMYLYKCGALTACVYCNATNIRNIRPVCAFQKTFRLALKHVCNCKECRNLLTLLRESSPALFENRGNKTKPNKPEQLNIRDMARKIRSIQTHEVKKSPKNRGQRFGVLDVTKTITTRPVAHSDIHGDKQYVQDYRDCVNWCLPGPVEFWNDLLMAVVKNFDGFSSNN